MLVLIVQMIVAGWIITSFDAPLWLIISFIVVTTFIALGESAIQRSTRRKKQDGTRH